MFDAPTWLRWLAFGLSLSGITAIFVLSGATALRDDFQFFPPPSRQSWQHKAFLILFRVFLYPLIALTLFVFEPSAQGRLVWLWVLGSLLMVAGFGMAFRITFQMGWRNAFGEKRGLMTTGWFSRSRNPVYIFTWLGLIGWALVAQSSLVTVLLLAWALLYVFAPIFEEPWLAEQYGETYLDYKRNVPRFFRL